MKNTNKTNPNLTPVNIKQGTLPADLLTDLSNRAAMFAHGFVDFDRIYIKQTPTTAPKDLAEFDANMRASGSVFFYVIELDDEKRRARGFWSYIRKSLVFCQVSAGRCVPWAKPQDYYKHARKDFENLDDYWRKSDYEEARKCASRIFCIYQNDHRAEIIAKQKQREDSQDFWENVRHEVIKCELSFDPVKGLNRVSTLITRDALSRICSIVGGGRYYNYYYSSDFKYKNKDDALAHYFDASGYYIKDRAGLMRQRTQMLKDQRARERLAANNYDDEEKTLIGLYGLLTGSFKELSDKFLALTYNNIEHRVFWFTQRLEVTCDALKEVSDTFAKISGKTYDGDLALLKDFEKVSTRAQHVLAKNRAWLEIDDEKRANHDNLEDIAIYYNLCEFVSIGGGSFKCVLDLKKAEQKLTER